VIQVKFDRLNEENHRKTVILVVAADGFTYEREAIRNWFLQSNRSPMTNQELDSLELKTNHAIKSLLQSLSDTSQKK